MQAIWNGVIYHVCLIDAISLWDTLEFSKLKFRGKSISDMYQLIGKCLKLKDDFYRVGRALKPSAIIDL